MLPTTSKKDPQDREVSDREKALVGDFKKRIEAAEKLHEQRFKQYEENRKYVTGQQHTDGAPGLVRTNLIFSTIATLLPQTYARDPDISVSPSEAVDSSQYENIKGFGRTLEAVLTRLFVKDAKLKRRAKAMVRAAMTCEIGWVKVTYQKDIQKDPVIQGRIEDAQENLQQLRALVTRADDSTLTPTSDDLNAAKIEALLASLREKVEVVIEKGLVIDKLLSEAVLVLDPTIRDFDEYSRASALAQVLWYDEDQFQANFGYKPSKKATVYRSAQAGKNPNEQANLPSSVGDVMSQFYCCYEIWDKRSNTVFTWCKGEEGFCRPPFRPQRMGRRWYPFFALGFNPVDGQFYPMSDVQLLIELQDEYNTTRTNFAEHRRKHIPVRVVRKGGTLTPEDVDKVQHAENNEVIVISGAASTKISDEIAILEPVPIDPRAYDTTPIRADIEMVSGAADSVRGNVLKAKTATEAEIMQQGLMSRTSERQDTIEDCIQEMAEYSSQIFLQELPVNEVTEIAGPKAVWPTLAKDAVFDLVNIEIKAGSTGKPNRQREREQWLELVPVVQDTMAKATELRAQGHMDLAESMTELVRETFRRFDERIDVDSFLPPAADGQAGGQAQAMLPQMQMKLAQYEQQVIPELQQALAQCQQELQTCQQKAVSNDGELTVKREIAVGDREHQAGLKKLELDHNRETQLQLQREKLDHEMRMAPMEAAAASGPPAAPSPTGQTPGSLTRPGASRGDSGTAQALVMVGQMIRDAMQAQAAAFEKLTAVVAAPRQAVRGPDGRIQSSVIAPPQPGTVQ